MTTGYTFRASWPIRDTSRTFGMLRAEACEQIDSIALQAGARIVGDIEWTVVNGRLIAQAPAVPRGLERAA